MALSSDIASALSDKSRPLREDLGQAERSCDRHGAYQSSGMRVLICKPPREIWTACPKCSDEIKAAARAAIEAQRQAELKSQVEAMMQQTALPPRFIGRTFDSYRVECPEQEAVFRTCLQYAQNFGQNLRRGGSLVLSGRPGTGKSHLAAAILQHILPQHVGVYMTLMDMVRMTRDTWRRGSEITEIEVLDRLQRVPLLVLDEIGAQYGTDGEKAILFDVLDRRYRDMKPVVMLTNLAKGPFREAIGDRVFDRLREVATWVSFDWDSFRPHAREGI